MNQDILNYIASQQVCVLAVEMLDGSPHAATVHFAHATEPFVLYFETCKDYRKAEALLQRPRSRASVVIGTHEQTVQTLQIDGHIQLLSASEYSAFDAIYLKKFPQKTEKLSDPKYIRFTFVPTWWRYTHWMGESKQIINSTD